jgi:hypothetical protein
MSRLALYTIWLSLVAVAPLNYVLTEVNRTSRHGESDAYTNDGAPKLVKQKSVTEIDEIRFSFDPTDPTRERDEPSVHMVLRENGEAHVFLFERDGSAVLCLTIQVCQQYFGLTHVRPTNIW